jgi:hypothetical protein
MSVIPPAMNNANVIPRTLIVDLSMQYGGSSSRVLSLLKHLPSSRIGLAGIAEGEVTQRALALGHNVHIIGKRKFDPRTRFWIPRMYSQNSGVTLLHG